MNKGFKIFLLTLALLIAFTGVAAAAPSMVYYNNAAGEIVKADATNPAIEGKFREAQNNGRYIVVVDGTKFVNWTKAAADGINYAAALQNQNYLLASAPTPIKELKADGTEGPVGSETVVEYLTALKAVAGLKDTTLTFTAAQGIAKVDVYQKINQNDYLVEQAINPTGTITKILIDGPPVGGELTLKVYLITNPDTVAKEYKVPVEAKPAVAYLTDIIAKYDGQSMTLIKANVAPEVTKVEVLINDTDKKYTLAIKDGPNNTKVINSGLYNIPAGTELTVKATVGSTIYDYPVTVN